MNITEIKKKAVEVILEKCADLEHARWAKWQKYMHSKMKSDGGIYMQLHYDDFMRWERQIATPYLELSEKEKESDREQVREYLPLLEEQLDIAVREVVGMIRLEKKMGNSTHGSCCICKCKNDYDDCTCQYNSACEDLEKLVKTIIN